MRISRIYHNGTLKINSTITLDPRNYHYLLNVLRLKESNDVIIFNGDGNNYIGKIARIDKKTVEIKIYCSEPARSESPLFIELGQGISRANKMDFILQKSVELGVNRIVPLITERSHKIRPSTHWEKIIISACEQSGRAYIPELTPAQSLQEWLSEKREGLSLVCDLQTNKKILDPSTGKNPTRVTLLIGSEGGLSDSEIEKATGAGFIKFSLGPRILRTETATITAISLMQAYFGDLLE